jgi:Protein of unknown function (DUF2934)
MIPLQSRKPAMSHSQIAKQQASEPVENAAPDPQGVAVRAYEMWLERGCPDGSPELDWYRAEQELSAAAPTQPLAKNSPIADSEPRTSLAAG